MDNKITGVVRRNKYGRYVKAACATIYMSSIIGNSGPRATITNRLYRVMFDYFCKYDKALADNTGSNEELNDIIKKIRIPGISKTVIKHAKEKGYELEQKFYECGEEYLKVVGSKYSRFQQQDKDILFALLGIKPTNLNIDTVFNHLLFIMKHFMVWVNTGVPENNPEPEFTDIKDSTPVFNDEYEEELEAILNKCIETRSPNEGEHAGLNPSDVSKYIQFSVRRSYWEENGVNVDSLLQRLKNEMLIQLKDEKKPNITLSESKINNAIYEALRNILSNK